jgi:hypothetical protein
MRNNFIVLIQVIPHQEQSYDTCGNYQRTDRGINIQVTNMKNWKYSFLVSLHELIEVALCEHRGITDKVIDGFDINYEANRKEGDLSEPGDELTSPYFNEHQTATRIEKEIAKELGVNWEEYDKTVCEL